MSEIPPLIAETRQERVSTSGSLGPGSAARGGAVTRTSVVAADPAYRGVQLVWFLLGLTELIVGLRVLFRAIAATDTGFVSFIYGISAPLVAPFGGIANYTSGHTTIEIGSLIAMAVYGVAAFLVVMLVRIATTPRTPPVA